MPRTISTGQEDILFGAKYEVHTRVEVENSTGSMVTLSNLSSADWMRALGWNWNIDQPVPELTFSIRRDHGQSTGESLAPLDADSTFNYNSTAGWAALVYPGRELHVYTACSTPGGPAPASSAYDFVFQGEIDEMNWEASPMTGVARSRNMSRMFDRWVQSSTYSYGESTTLATSTNAAVELVIEQILANWTNLSTSILLTPVSPNFLIAPKYTPEKQRVLDAITANAMLPGFTLQEVWSTASTSWRLKFSEPNRDATSSEKNWTFGANDYFDVKLMRVSREDVRNYISGIWGSGASSQRLIVQSTSSQDAFELQWLEFEEAANSAIATSSEMSTLLTAALGDLKEPYVTTAIELPYFYPVELGDFIEFEANGVHYSTNQYLAVVGVTHVLEPNRHRTTITCRGKPAGHRLQWLQYRGGGNLVFAEVYGIEISFDVDGKAVVAVSASEGEAKNIYVTVGDGTTPADPTAAANNGTISGYQGIVNTGVAITAGNDAIVKAIAADAAGILGPVISAQLGRRLGVFYMDSTDRVLNSTVLTNIVTMSLYTSQWSSQGSVSFEGSAYNTWGTTGSTGNRALVVVESSSGGSVGFYTHIMQSPTTQWQFALDVSRGQTSTTTRFMYSAAVFPAGTDGVTSVVERRQVTNFSSSGRLDIIIRGLIDSTANPLTVDWTRGLLLGGR